MPASAGAETLGSISTGVTRGVWSWHPPARSWKLAEARDVPDAAQPPAWVQPPETRQQALGMQQLAGPRAATGPGPPGSGKCAATNTITRSDPSTLRIIRNMVP